MKSVTQFWRSPVMPYVESRRACDSRACYRLHSHPTFSIGAVDHGASVFTGAAGGPVELGPEAVVFVPPDCSHACNPERGVAWSYQMLHIDASWVQAVRQEEEPRRDREGEGAIQITRDPAIYAHLCRLNELLFSNASVHDKEAALIEFVGNCHHASGQPIPVPPNAAECRQRLQALLDLLNQEDGTPSLSELAGLAGVSRYQMIRMFRAATGLTPHAWQLNQRINQARAQLRAGEDLAEVAYRLGFADQSHFQRTFKAHVGVTPGRYRS